MYGWGDAGGLLVALLCGSGEYTDKAVGDAFCAAGLAHVLALSGMHLSFFAGLAATVFRGGGRKISLVLSLGAVLLFVWFAGLTPSLLRATICSLLGMATGIRGIKSPMIRILSLCFFIHLVLAPQDLFQLSFQLSYLALAGILVIGPCFEPLTHKFLPAPVATSVSASVGAQIFSTPVTLLSLGTMMPGGIIASVVVSPLVSLFMTVGVGAIILSLLWAPLGEPLGHLVNLLYTCLVIPVKLFARIPALELP
jgi:competence protein ComEC